MTCIKKSIGIDIAKKYLDVYCHEDAWFKRYHNTPAGIDKLLRMLTTMAGSVHRIVLEPSGGYERPLLEALATQGYPVSIVPAHAIRYFTRAERDLAKTDKIDAQVLGRYGAIFSPPLFQLKDKPRLLLSEWVNRRDQLSVMLIAEKGRLDKTSNEDIREAIMQSIETLTKQCKAIDGFMKQLLRDHLKEQASLLFEEKGVGPQTTAVLLGLLPELGLCTKAQIAKLVGVAPMTRESGMWQGNRSIRGGRKRVRNALYMATLSAVRFNKKLKLFYQALCAKGKPVKVVLIACMRKLLIILNAKFAAFYKTNQHC